MGKLIDSDPVAERITDAWDRVCDRDDGWHRGFAEWLRMAVKCLAEAPQVEVPDIVRCCGCKSWHDGECDHDRINNNPYAFCSYGTRRQE